MVAGKNLGWAALLVAVGGIGIGVVVAVSVAVAVLLVSSAVSLFAFSSIHSP